MSNLAIRGHATRGKEVIEILEMLGGKNGHWNGTRSDWFYFIVNGIIYTNHVKNKKLFQVYTLEEFLEKFPYKIGDKVMIKERDKVVTITDMSWRNGREIIYETIHNGDCYECFSSEELRPYKEETMDKTNKAVFDANAQCCDIMSHIIKEETMKEIKIDIPKGYEFAGVDDDKQQIVFTKIQPHYPKTYEECCEVLLLKPERATYSVSGLEYKRHLIVNLQRLLICRDAYWKIAGGQMGLGKPLEPDWDNENQFKYGLYHFRNGIMYDGSCINSTLLSFPTEEMRDTFYENFKDLIEKCKELL